MLRCQHCLKCEIRFVLLTVELNSALVKNDGVVDVIQPEVQYKALLKKNIYLLPSDTVILLRYVISVGNCFKDDKLALPWEVWLLLSGFLLGN